MKKCFLLMAGIILLVFAACQSDELANGGRNGEVAASFSVQLPGNGNNAGEPLYHGNLPERRAL